MRNKLASVLLVVTLFALPSFAAARRPESPGDPGSKDSTVVRIVKTIIIRILGGEIIVPTPTPPTP